MAFDRKVGLAGASLVLLACVGMLGCERAGPPAAVEVEARPGSVVVIPFKKSVKGKEVNALGVIPAEPKFSPKPLPNGATALHWSLSLFGKGAVEGNLLVQVPEESTGDIEFSLSAHGSGRAQFGSLANFSTEPVHVTIKPNGSPIDKSSPVFTGEWVSDQWSWTFEGGAIPALRTRHAKGETKSLRFRAYADGSGGWFLIEPVPDGVAYWIRMNGAGEMLVAHPDKEFRPFLKLKRVAN